MDDDVLPLLCGTPELPPDRVALTFDDGPGPRSAELARMLRDEGVPGTFFVLGESLERHGEVLDTYRDCGQAIGLHGVLHRPFTSAENAAYEVSRCAERISGYLGETTWFRPPCGMGEWPVPGFAAGRLACAGPGLGHHVPPRADGGCLRGYRREQAHPAPRRHRPAARLRVGYRVQLGSPDRGRPGPADHRDHGAADRALAPCGTLPRAPPRQPPAPRAP